MEQYKQEFINFMVESEVLKFGEFTLKSGRKSPFFMNSLPVIVSFSIRNAAILSSASRFSLSRRFASS